MSTDLITLIYLCHHAFIAQLDRAFVYGTKGLGFESLWTHQKSGECRFFYYKNLKDFIFNLLFL